MSNSIKLSEKHGVNPTIPVCMYCGGSKNEIALMGHLGDYRKGEDFEAPRNVILDYEPCDHCKETWDRGVTLIGVVNFQPKDGRPPIQKQGNETLYPTGKALTFLNLEVAREFLNSPDINIGQRVLVEDSIIDYISDNTKRGEANE